MKYMVMAQFFTQQFLPMDTEDGAKFKARELLKNPNVQYVNVVDMETGEVLDPYGPVAGEVFENQPA